MSTENVLIIGVNGFIGLNLFMDLSRSKTIPNIYGTYRKTSTGENLKRTHYLRTVLPDNLLEANETQSLKDIIADIKPSVIINCTGLLFGDDDVAKYLMVNAVLPVELIAFARDHGLSKFMHLSTIDVLNPDSCTLLDQNHYQFSKWVGEKLIQQACHSSNLDFTFLRPSTTFGKYMNKSRLIANILQSASQNKPVVLNGDIEKNFISSVDVCKAVEREIYTSRSAALNICSEKFLTLRELVEISSDALGVDIGYKLAKPTAIRGDVSNYSPSVAIWENGRFNSTEAFIFETEPITNSLARLYKTGSYSTEQLPVCK